MDICQIGAVQKDQSTAGSSMNGAPSALQNLSDTTPFDHLYHSRAMNCMSSVASVTFAST